MMDFTASLRTDRTIAISSAVRSDLERFYPIDDEDIVEVLHGVDIEHFHPERASHHAVSAEKFTVLHVGRLVSRKHIELGIEGLAASEREDIELLIAGTGDHRAKLESRARELGVVDQTRFLGFVPETELSSLYAGSDALLFVPRFEGFDLTFLEAMASGTPVIGTRTGGLPDLGIDGENCVFVEHRTDEVGSAIDRLASDGTFVDELSSAARETAERRTWDVVAEETESIYEEAVDENE